MITTSTYNEKNTLEILLGKVVHSKAFEKFGVKIYDSQIMVFNIFDNRILEEADFHLFKSWINQTQVKRYYSMLIPGERSEVKESFKKAALESNNIAIAESIVVTNLAQRMIANLYVRFDKPKIPTRVFSDEESAAFWLMSFR